MKIAINASNQFLILGEPEYEVHPGIHLNDVRINTKRTHISARYTDGKMPEIVIQKKGETEGKTLVWLNITDKLVNVSVSSPDLDVKVDIEVLDDYMILDIY